MIAAFSDIGTNAVELAWEVIVVCAGVAGLAIGVLIGRYVIPAS